MNEMIKQNKTKETAGIFFMMMWMMKHYSMHGGYI